MKSVTQCPYKVGQRVVYRPSQRGLDSEVMASPTEKLIQGKTYVISSIEKNLYLEVQGNTHPGGGLFWTEFVPE